MADRRKKPDRMDRLRRIILVSVLGAVAVVAIYLTLYGFGVAPGLTAGSSAKPYFALNRPVERDPLEVVEFFSFDCVHCRRLDPIVDRWQNTLPEGVTFRRVHVGFAPTQRVLARAHETLIHKGAIEQNRERIFRELHDRNKSFVSLEQIAEFVDGHGIAAAEFLTLANGNRMGARVAANLEYATDVGIVRFPAFLVGNRYMVYTVSRREDTLSDIRYMVDELLAGREPDLEALGAIAAPGSDTENVPDEPESAGTDKAEQSTSSTGN